MESCTTSLGEITTYHLMIELIYEGRAEIIPELEILEPFDIKEIRATLQSRAQKNFGTDLDKWIDWFMGSEGIATDSERETFRLLKEFKDQNDYYVAKLASLNGLG